MNIDTSPRTVSLEVRNCDLLSVLDAVGRQHFFASADGGQRLTSGRGPPSSAVGANPTACSLASVANSRGGAVTSVYDAARRRESRSQSDARLTPRRVEFGYNRNGRSEVRYSDAAGGGTS